MKRLAMVCVLSILMVAGRPAGWSLQRCLHQRRLLTLDGHFQLFSRPYLERRAETLKQNDGQGTGRLHRWLGCAFERAAESGPSLGRHLIDLARQSDNEPKVRGSRVW